MNKFIYTIFISFYVNIVLSQVSIGNSSVTNSDVILDLSNSNNGALLLSSKTSILPTGPQGMMIFDSDDDMIFYSKDENILKPYTKMITELSFSEKLFSGTYNYQIRAYNEEGSVILSEILNFTYESND